MEKGAIPMQQSYDVVIIGGGVVGSAIARELSRYTVSYTHLRAHET